MTMYTLINNRPTDKRTGQRLPEYLVVDILNQQASRVRELETWLRLLLGGEPTIQLVKAARRKPGSDATNRRIRTGQLAAAYPNILGRVVHAGDQTVELDTDAGVKTCNCHSVVVYHDPNSV